MRQEFGCSSVIINGIGLFHAFEACVIDSSDYERAEFVVELDKRFPFFKVVGVSEFGFIGVPSEKTDKCWGWARVDWICPWYSGEGCILFKSKKHSCMA